VENEVENKKRTMMLAALLLLSAACGVEAGKPFKSLRKAVKMRFQVAGDSRVRLKRDGFFNTYHFYVDGYGYLPFWVKKINGHWCDIRPGEAFYDMLQFGWDNECELRNDRLMAYINGYVDSLEMPRRESEAPREEPEALPALPLAFYPRLFHMEPPREVLDAPVAGPVASYPGPLFNRSIPASASATQQGNTCSICFELLGGQVETTLCEHQFHRNCLQEWLHRSENCPSCCSRVQLVRGCRASF